MTATEIMFASIADRARRGDFQVATKQLDELAAGPRDVRTRYLALLFQCEVLLRQFRLAGGGITLDPDTRYTLMTLQRRRRGYQAAAFKLATDLGETDKQQALAIIKAQSQTGVINGCLELVPFFRYARVEPGFAAQVEKRVGDLGASCANSVASFPDADFSAARNQITRTLLGKLVSARIAILLNGDPRRALTELQAGLQTTVQQGWFYATALWLLRIGDLQVAPRGSVLSFGYELAAESNVRPELGVLRNTSMGSANDVTYERRDTSPTAAERSYDLAREANRAAGHVIRPSEFAVRSAYLTYLRGAPAGAEFLKAAELAAAEDSSWNEVMARTSAALLTGSRDAFVSAYQAATRHANFGAVVSMAQLGLSWSDRAAIDGDYRSASDRLRLLADILASHDFDMSRADILMKAADFDSDLGRDEAAIQEMSDAIAERTKFRAKVVADRPHSSLDAEPWEVIDESDVSVKIGIDLAELTSDLFKLEATEDIPVTERREKAQREMQQLLSSSPQAAAALGTLTSESPYLKARAAQIKAQAAQIESFKKLQTCPSILHEFYAHAANPRDSDRMLEVGTLIMAGSCDSKLLEAARASMERLDPVKPIEVAAGKIGGAWDPRALIDLHHALDDAELWLILADKAEAGALLDRWTRRIEATLAGTPAAQEQAPLVKYYRARALTLLGRNEQARDMLLSVCATEPFWSFRALPAFRLQVLDAIVEVEVKLGHADASLLAAEQERAEQERSRELTSEVRPGNADSAEAAMLLRRAALEGNLDRSRLVELQRRSRPSLPDPRLPTADELQFGIRSLPADTTALVYRPLRHELAIWRIDSQISTRLIRVPVDGEEIRRLAVQFRGELASGVTGWEKTSQTLDRYLIAPAGPITAGQTVAVTGIELLGGIPFEMLGATADSVLMKTHPVVYVGSLACRRNAAVLKSRNTKALVVGINTGGLMAPEAEAAQVAARLGTSALTGPSATVANVRRRLTDAGLVHLAADGNVDLANPYRSYLSLADGPLEAWAILHDAAAAELIVLSACNTRRGPGAYMKQFTSDESSISGLALRAGARRILSSLWGASDRSSQALMDAFYEQWLRDPAQPARALQRAKLAIAPQVGQPMGYANFVLTVRNPGLIRIGQ